MKKKIFLLLIAVIGVLSLTIFQNKAEASNEKKEESYMVYADYPEYATASDLVSASDVAFSGKVTNIDYGMLSVSETEETADIPYTFYTVKISHEYRGTLKKENVTIKRPGGVINGTEYTLDEAFKIEKGKEYLFLVENFDDSYPSLISADQASYDMNVNADISQVEGGFSLQDVLNVLE